MANGRRPLLAPSRVQGWGIKEVKKGGRAQTKKVEDGGNNNGTVAVISFAAAQRRDIIGSWASNATEERSRWCVVFGSLMCGLQGGGGWPMFGLFGTPPSEIVFNVGVSLPVNGGGGGGADDGGGVIGVEVRRGANKGFARVVVRAGESPETGSVVSITVVDTRMSYNRIQTYLVAAGLANGPYTITIETWDFVSLTAIVWSSAAPSSGTTTKP